VTRPARLAIAMLCGITFGCSPDLPERESPAARLYAERCNGCHKLHAPGSMTAAMWDMQVERMQGELVRRGIPPLTNDERAMVLNYLHRHSSGAQPTQKEP